MLQADSTHRCTCCQDQNTDLADVGAGLAFTAGNTQTAGQKGKITQDIILGYLTNVCMHHRFILSSSKGQSAAL